MLNIGGGVVLLYRGGGKGVRSGSKYYTYSVVVGGNMSKTVKMERRGGEALLSSSKRFKKTANSSSSITTSCCLTHTHHNSSSLSGGLVPLKFEQLLVEKTWLESLTGEFEKPYAKDLCTFVESEIQNGSNGSGSNCIYPPLHLIFNALNSTPFDGVKVVIIGQDPYHGPGQAMGLSFSVPEGIKIPSSLINIYKELQQDLGCSIPLHGNLERWASQGVLLLNAVLTVKQHQANSHSKKGWELFTDAVIKAISEKKKGVVFLLWGNYAQAKCKLIDGTMHHILKAAHPSGLSAHRGFFGCRHFSRTNELLESMGMSPIDWQL